MKNFFNILRTTKMWPRKHEVSKGCWEMAPLDVFNAGLSQTFNLKKKKAVAAKHSEAEHNKMRLSCIDYNWTLCFYICVVYLFGIWFLYSVVSSRRMGMCSAYLLCPSTSRIIADIIMRCINICFFFVLICSVLFFLWIAPFHFFKKKTLFFRAV